MQNYKIMDDCIEVSNKDFDIRHILECGQVFRFEKRSFGYTVYTLSQKADIYCQKDCSKIYCKDKNYFINYFDLNTNYAKIKLDLKDKFDLSYEVTFGKGIRILKQDPIEMIVSFIISANNNIPRIKQIIERICEKFGTRMDGYYAFPTLQQLSNISENDFRNMGCGYRSGYLESTIKDLKNFDYMSLFEMSSEDARKRLMGFKGVGRKVADCILLFGFGKTDVFPTDTWIVKAYQDKFGKSLSDPKEISKIFTKLYGNLSGYAQQYMFYTKRENKE